jgi:hypothetical protein
MGDFMKIFLLATISLFCVSSAFAKGEQEQEQVQRVGFEELKEACLNPARFHNQAAPTNIQITCGEMQNKWVADEDGKMPLSTRRVIMTAIVSNKYTVSPITTELESAEQAAPCTRFKQLLETVETVVSTTCEQLLSFKGTSNEYCTQAIDGLRVASPASVKVQETGKKVSFCGERKHKHSKEGKQDQDQSGKQDQDQDQSGKQDQDKGTKKS